MLPYTVPSCLLIPLWSTCIICPPCHHLPSLSCPFISPCQHCLPLSLPPLSLSIPVGGDMAVSTHSTLWVNAHSGGGQVLGHHHSCCLLPMLSLTTHLPCKLGPAVVVVLPPSPLVIIIPPNPPHKQWLVAVLLPLVPFHPWSTPWAVPCEAGGSWWVILVSEHYQTPL